MRRLWTGYIGWPLWLAVIVVVLDQVTKITVDALHPVGWNFPVIPGVFDLVHVRNMGAAWGIFSEHTWLLGIISLVAFVLLVAFFDSLTEKHRWPALFLGLVSGGIFGNMIDRLIRGSVVDFLDFHWQEAYHYPSFNVADSAICVGVALLVIYSFFFNKKENPSDASKAEP